MAANDEAIVQYQKASCVRGYHIDQETGEAATGKTLVCVVEPRSFNDRNTVAVEKDEKDIGHLQ